MTPSQPNRRVLLLFGSCLLGITGFRLWYASILGIAPDEAYYRQWSTALSMVYRDHPPAVAWMMRLGTWAFGETALGLRVVAVGMSIPAALGVYLIGREMKLSPTGAVWGALISTLLIAPASAAVICTPDTFLGVSWILAVLAAIHLRRGDSPLWWYLFAAAFAAGICSKHSALLLLPLIFIAFFGRRSKAVPRLRRLHPLIAGVGCLVLLLPYGAAEIRSGFASTSFQLSHLAGRLPGAEQDTPFIAAIRIIEVLSGQIGLLSPLVAGFLGVYLLRIRDDISLLLKAAVLLPIFAAIIAGFFTHPEQNWASLGHPLTGPMVVAGLHHLFPKAGKARQRALWSAGTALSVVAVFVIVHVHSLRPILPLPPPKDPTARLHGWSALKRLAAAVETADAVVCDNYGLAAELDWELRGRRNSTPVITSPDRNPLPAAGNWLLVSQENDFGGGTLPTACAEISPLMAIPLTLPNGREWDRVLVFYGTDCRQ